MLVVKEKVAKNKTVILFFSREERRENVCSYSTQQIKDLVIYHQNNRPGF